LSVAPGLADLDFSTSLDNAISLNKALADQATLRDEIATAEAAYEAGEATLSRENLDALDAEITSLYARKAANEDLFAQLSVYRTGLEKLASTFGITEQEAANLVITMTAVKAADTTEARVAATLDLAKAIDEATGGLNMASEKGIALYNALLDAALAGLDLKSLDLPGALSSAATEATRIADELGRAASNAISMAAQSLTSRTESEIRLRFAGDPIATARAIAETRAPSGEGLPDGAAAFVNRQRETYIENEVAAAEAQLALSKFNETMKGGASSAKDIGQEAARLYESTRTEAERFAAEQEKVETLYRAGAISGEVYTRALEDLNAKFDPFTKLVEGIADTVENELNSAFASVLDGTKSLGDALLGFASNVLAKVAQDLFAEQFAAPITAGIKSFIGSEDGNVFGPSGFVPFAKGGVVSGPTIFPFANGTGIMGEAGPEAIMPLSRGSDGKLGVVAANGNSAPNITINNYSGQEATSSTDSAGNIVVEIGRAIAQDITSGGPTYRAIRTTFGLGNRLQQRG